MQWDETFSVVANPLSYQKQASPDKIKVISQTPVEKCDPVGNPTGYNHHLKSHLEANG